MSKFSRDRDTHSGMRGSHESYTSRGGKRDVLEREGEAPAEPLPNPRRLGRSLALPKMDRIRPREV